MIRLLLTRPQAQSTRFLAELGAGFTAISSPLLEIAYTDGPVHVGAAKAVVFTSSNGVQGWAQRGGLADLPAFCVGERTAQAAARLGFRILAHAPTLPDLAAILNMTGHDALLHIRGSHVAGDLAALLPDRVVETCIVYEAVAQPLRPDAHDALCRGAVDAIPVFSPRTARRLVAERRDGWQLDKTRLIAISAATAEALIPLTPARIEIANSPDAAGMLALLHRKSAQ